MTFYANDVHPVPPDCGADACDDQLPLISRVGRGLKGDSSRVVIAEPDGCTETHLEGGYWDEGDKTFHSEWISQNINGGELKYQYNLRPYTIPRTFTITFIYKRPGRHEWSWTTPAIPYIWTLDPAGKPDEDPDHVVGSGVATIFVKTAHDGDWSVPRDERLWYPRDPDNGLPYPREDFNAPLPEEGWSATIVFGHGGDVDVPDFDDIAKIIGTTKQNIYNILEDRSVTINGITAKNLIEYIDKCDRRDRDHFHKDLGFNSEGHPESGAFGGQDTVKAYIDKRFADLNFDFDINNTAVTKTVGIGTFQNRSGHSYFDRFNGLDCGNARVVYGYSEELRLVQIRVDYDSVSSVPLPFGNGMADKTLLTLPSKIRPKRQIRYEFDVPPGSNPQRLWLWIEPDGRVLLHGVTTLELYDMLTILAGITNPPCLTAEQIHATAAPHWECSCLMSYFYSMG